MIFAVLPMAGGTAASSPHDAAVSSGLADLYFSVPLIEEQRSGWQLVIEERIIIRVPARRSSLNNFASTQPSPRSRQSPIVWTEKKGPKCISMRDIAGMQTTQRDSIDIITRQNQRLRAQFDRGCRALDFYAGFYMERNKDGRLCEGRDELHARTGAKCEVAKFRLMVPETRED